MKIWIEIEKDANRTWEMNNACEWIKDNNYLLSNTIYLDQKVTDKTRVHVRGDSFNEEE